MLNQLLQVMTPELISKAIRENPTVIMTVVRNTEVFKSLGRAITVEQQEMLSKHIASINEFLGDENGKRATSMWVSGFCDYVAGKAVAVDRAAKEAKLRAELEPKLKARIDAEAKKLFEEELRKELDAKLNEQ